MIVSMFCLGVSILILPPGGMAEPLDSNWVTVSGVIQIMRTCHNNP